MYTKTAHKQGRAGCGLKTRVGRLLTLVLSAALLPFVPISVAHAGSAGSSSGVLLVSVRIEPYATLKVVSQAQAIVVTDADIRQGYVDVNSASLFQIKTNSTMGYRLAFENTGATFTEVRVEGPGIDSVLTNGTGFVYQPYSRATVSLPLSYRFTLSGNISPGTYAWPLAVSVNPVR